jgi:methionine-S-sulfoxide reductase
MPTQTIVLAGGCFWCTEAAFEQLEGVLDVTSGYTGGSRETANYKAVCSGDTGHAEAIRITYDPAKITLDQLLDVFFDAHDPTQLNRQGNDTGTQYRSAIFYASDAEKQAAEAKIRALNESKHFPRPIVTTLEPLREFFPAEDYHQDYARNNPGQPYIQAVSIPKVCKVREKHAGLIRRG